MMRSAIRSAACLALLATSAGALSIRGGIAEGEDAKLAQGQVAAADLNEEVNTAASQLEAQTHVAVDMLLETMPNSSSTTGNASMHRNVSAPPNATHNRTVQLAATGNASMHRNVSAPLNATHNRTAQLAEQQQVLQHLLAHLKSKIVDTNKQEAENKDEAKKQIAELEKKLATEHQQLNSTNLTKFRHSLLVNRTRSDANLLAYWKRSRDLHHGMYHSGLKVSHGLISRVKSVLDAYKEIMSTGKVSPDVAKKLRGLNPNVPK